MPFLQNRYMKFIGIGIVGLFILVVVSVFVLNTLTSSAGLSDSMMGESVSRDSMNMMQKESFDSAIMPMQPETSDYSSGLEDYETTSYAINGRIKEFDLFCDTLEVLKANVNNDFKNLRRSTNNCRATFYTTENNATDVLTILESYSGIEYSRDTSSVTKHRQQIQSQTAIIAQQLASVERTLFATEMQFDEIAIFAQANNDAQTLSQTVREKLSLIDTLTQRKINLTDQLNQKYQQAAELEQRIGVVEFTVQVHRSQPLTLNETAQQWERAWSDLSDTFTETLIGVTTTFVIFILWTIRISLYLLVAVIALRGLWKFVRFIWSKW